MAHKTLIDGTAYEIDGGKAMVDGTVYEIDKGTTLVDGTAYEVGFSQTVTVKIIRDSYYAGKEYVSIEGVKYQNGGTLEVPIGTVIYCYAEAGNKEETGEISIKLNGQDVSTLISSVMGAEKREYYYYVNEDMKNGKVLIRLGYDGSAQDSYVGITEIPEGHAEVSIGGAFRYAWVTVNGISHTAQTVVLPIGTVIECTLDADDEATGTPNVVLNGATVKTGTGTYMYTVTKNASVYCYTSGKAGVIHITEN